MFTDDIDYLVLTSSQKENKNAVDVIFKRDAFIYQSPSVCYEYDIKSAKLRRDGVAVGVDVLAAVLQKVQHLYSKIETNQAVLLLEYVNTNKTKGGK
tara:strand:+ start:3038 stop:3328 length:291 start_codon:yes stop_codon:yes gene_type:complete